VSLWHRVIHPITQHFRRGRGRFLDAQFPDIRRMRICDLGGSRHFWDKLNLDVPRQNITIYNISSDETQGVDAAEPDGIKVVLYDGQRLPVGDSSFDLLVCNSVLEHVPPKERTALVAEMHRVSRQVFCQTPARSFPLEPHFLMPFVHWLPRRVGFVLAHVSPWRLLSRPNAETIREYWWGTQLLDQEEIARLFPRASIESERFLGLVKSYYVVSSSASTPTR